MLRQQCTEAFWYRAEKWMSCMSGNLHENCRSVCCKISSHVAHWFTQKGQVLGNVLLSVEAYTPPHLANSAHQAHVCVLMYTSVTSCCAECRCHQTLGAAVPELRFFCTHQDCIHKKFNSIHALQDHQRKNLHDSHCSTMLCQECGRLHQKQLRPVTNLVA